MKEFKL